MSLFDRVQARWNRCTPKEKILIIGGSVLLAIGVIAVIASKKRNKTLELAAAHTLKKVLEQPEEIKPIELPSFSPEFKNYVQNSWDGRQNWFWNGQFLGYGTAEELGIDPLDRDAWR